MSGDRRWGAMPDGQPRSGSQRTGAPRFATAALTTLATRLGVAALSFAGVLIVARALGPEGRGEVALLTTIAMVSSQLARLGVDEANANIAGAEPERRRALASNSLLLALALGGLCVGVLVPLTLAFPRLAGGLETVPLAIAFAAIPMLLLQAFLTFLIRAEYGFTVTNVAWVLGPLGTVLVSALLWALGLLTVTAAFAAWVGAHAVATLLLAGYVAARLGGFGRPDARLASRTLGFGLKTHVGRVLLVGNYRVDQWFVGAIAGPRELGLYSVAVAWAEVLFYVPTVFVLVQRPYLVRSSASEAARRSSKVFRAGILATVPLVGALVLVATPLCSTIFGAEFSGAVDDLRVLALGAFGVVALQQLGNALTAQRMPGLASAAAGVAFAVTIALDVALIPPLGGLGAAIASSAAYSVGGLATIALFLRAFGVRPSVLIPRGRDAARLPAEIAAVVRPSRQPRPRD